MKAKQIVTLIGWIWFGLGVMAFMSGLSGLVMSSIMRISEAPMPKAFGPLGWIWEYYREAAAGQVVLALFIVFTAYNFVRRKAWARIGIQFFAALCLLWFVAFGVFWVYSISSLTAAPGSEQAATVMRIFMSVAGGVMMLGLASLFAFCIWLVSRPSVKEEFRQSEVANA
jgi:hypothetical protein